jgi:hypothetical protein
MTMKPFETLIQVNHPFLIYDVKGGHPAPLNYCLSNNAPVLTTKRLLVSGKNDADVWNQTQNQVMTSLLQKKCTVVIDCAPERYRSVSLGWLARSLSISNRFYINRAEPFSTITPYESIASKNTLIYWPICHAQARINAQLELVFDRLTLPMRERKLKGTNTSVLISNIKSASVFEQQEIWTTIKTLLQCQVNVYIGTSEANTDLERYAHSVGFSKVLMGYQPGEGNTGDYITYWEYEALKKVTLPTPKVGTGLIIQPASISL